MLYDVLGVARTPAHEGFNLRKASTQEPRRMYCSTSPRMISEIRAQKLDVAYRSMEAEPDHRQDAVSTQRPSKTFMPPCFYPGFSGTCP
jgi:hypothetical protein